MIFKNHCIFELRAEVASALEGLKIKIMVLHLSTIYFTKTRFDAEMILVEKSLKDSCISSTCGVLQF